MLHSSMIPATILVTKYPSNYVIPTSMCIWGVFTLLCFRAQSFSELAGYRFVIGILEGKLSNDLNLFVTLLTNIPGPYFCSIHYVLGSW